MDPELMCPYCGQEMNEDLEESIVDSPRGYAHEECAQEYEDDADGRAADYYYDTSIDS
jgi:hypothetical protein